MLSRRILHSCAATTSSVIVRGGELTGRRGYRAVIQEAIGKPLVVKDLPDEKPRKGKILVEVESAGVNNADLRILAGEYYLKPQLPFVPGFELAGLVKHVGDGVENWKEGDRILAIRTGNSGRGAWAEQCAVDADQDLVLPIPANVSFEQAAATAVTYGTAYLALQKMAQERQGANVLVTSSTGTLGFAAIDLAQNVFQCHVFAAADSDEKLAAFRETGCESTINYAKENLSKRVRDATMGHGVDVVVDAVGGHVFHQALEALKTGGHAMSVGFACGQIPSVSLLDLCRLQATVSGIWLGGRRQDEIRKVVETVLGLAGEDYLQVKLDNKTTLDGLPAAIEKIRKGDVFGKLIVNVKDK